MRLTNQIKKQILTDAMDNLFKPQLTANTLTHKTLLKDIVAEYYKPYQEWLDRISYPSKKKVFNYVSTWSLNEEKFKKETLHYGNGWNSQSYGIHSRIDIGTAYPVFNDLRAYGAPHVIPTTTDHLNRYKALIKANNKTVSNAATARKELKLAICSCTTDKILIKSYPDLTPFVPKEEGASKSMVIHAKQIHRLFVQKAAMMLLNY